MLNITLPWTVNERIIISNWYLCADSFKFYFITIELVIFSLACLLLCLLIFMSNSNADRVGWWELIVLASHVHPSVAAMARTLLSGVNIVYNGNPLADLSLGAFLDKFMEKKPKQSTWHGASQIEPAKKVSLSARQLTLGCSCFLVRMFIEMLAK